MKKSLIALAVLAASGAAYAGADVYGQVRMSVDHVNSSAADSDLWQISDRVSRIGVKGSEDLGGGMSAVYGLEWGINTDTATGLSGTTTNGVASLTARNQFVGLKSGFGTLLIGRHDAPYKLAGTADLFADTAADAAGETATPSATNANIIGRNGFDTRATQTVAYVSPDWNGFHFGVAGIPGETTGASEANGLADALSMTAVYKNGPLNASVSYQSYDKAFGTGIGGEDKNATKFNIGYTLGDVKLGYTHESSDADYDTGDNKDKGNLFSVAYGMGPITLMAQYGKFDDKNGTADLKSTTVGVNYAMSKRTAVYAAYADLDNETAADGKIFTMGLNHSF